MSRLFKRVIIYYFHSKYQIHISHPTDHHCIDEQRNFVFRLKNLESLRQHFRRLHDNAPSKQKESHMCEICAKIYSSKSGLEKHLEAHTDISETRAQCNICGKWLKNATYVRVHIRRIHDTVHQPIACPQCGKIKPHERSLKRHILECHTEANHKCNRCDKSFIYPVLLKVCYD